MSLEKLTLKRAMMSFPRPALQQHPPTDDLCFVRGKPFAFAADLHKPPCRGAIEL